MKNYLLTIIANLKNEDECQDIAVSLTPIVDSPHLKFQHKQGAFLLSFASEVDKTEIFDYITGILYGVTETFILTEITDNVSVSVPETLKSHLFDLENSGEDISMYIDLNQAKYNTEWMGEEDEEDYVALLLREQDSLIKTPTLDQILDKIALKGYNDLTQFEKDVLENYSKN